MVRMLQLLHMRPLLRLTCHDRCFGVCASAAALWTVSILFVDGPRGAAPKVIGMHPDPSGADQPALFGILQCSRAGLRPNGVPVAWACAHPIDALISLSAPQTSPGG
jgi:hypothetical protein